MTYKESNLHKSIDGNSTNLENSVINMVSSNEHHKKTEIEQLKKEVQDLKKMVGILQLNIAHFNKENNLSKQLIVYLYDYIGVYEDQFKLSRFKGKVLGDFIDEYQDFLKTYSLCSLEQGNIKTEEITKKIVEKKDFLKKMSLSDKKEYIKNIVLKKKIVVVSTISSIFRLSNSWGNRIIHSIVEEDDRFVTVFIHEEINSKSKSKRKQKVLALVLKDDNLEQNIAIKEEIDKILSSKPDIH